MKQGGEGGTVANKYELIKIGEPCFANDLTDPDRSDTPEWNEHLIFGTWLRCAIVGEGNWGMRAAAVKAAVS